MNKLALALGATLALGGALAQTSFPDVPEDNFAAEAVAELVELGILTGFPDGTFRGNEAFTRYQAALVLSRLLDVLEENAAAAGALSEEDLATLSSAVQELSTGLDELFARVEALEAAAPEGDAAAFGEELSALDERLSALEARGPDAALTEELAALEERLAALEAAGAEAPAVDVAALQEQVTALNAQVNDLQARLEAAPTPEAELEVTEVAPEEPEVDLDAPVAAPAAVTAPERGKFFLGLGSFYETDSADIGSRFRPRVTLGVDDLVAGFGLRATADYGRQTLIEAGSLALSGHLTYTLGVSAVNAYLGVGGGYQFPDLLFVTNTFEGAYAGALLGAEFGTGPLTFFVEGTADYYLDGVPAEGYNQLYPTIAAGLNLRP
jgi:polyhydroxyalkanoate synthesis regulator phasin